MTERAATHEKVAAGAGAPTAAGVSAHSLAAADGVLSRMPAEIRDTFSPAQRHALGLAITDAPRRKFIVNLRFSLFGVFTNFIIGREKRTAERRAIERRKHPLFTLGNLIALVIAFPFGVFLGWAAYQLLLHGQIF